MKITHKIWLFILSGAGLGLFGLYTLLVKMDRFTQLDFNMTVRIQDKVPTGLSDVFHLFSAVGHVGTMSVILFLGLLFLLKNKIGTVIVLFLFYAGQGGEFFLKKVLLHPGPPFQFHRVGSGTFFDKDYVVPGSSYPSGHSFRAMFMAVVLIYLIYKKYGWSTATVVTSAGLAGLAICIMAAKVILGEHWTTDIIGGALLGAATAFFALLFVR